MLSNFIKIAIKKLGSGINQFLVFLRYFLCNCQKNINFLEIKLRAFLQKIGITVLYTKGHSHSTKK